jgi:hypothetical protein
MADLLHSIGAHLRRWIGNRRIPARQRASIPCRVSVFDDRDHKSGESRNALLGKTIDMSYCGLAFLVPAIRIGHRYIAGENRTLRIILELPTGRVESYAVAKRYERLEAAGSDKGYLVGALITRMSENDKELLSEYLQSLKRVRG